MRLKEHWSGLRLGLAGEFRVSESDQKFKLGLRKEDGVINTFRTKKKVLVRVLLCSCQIGQK